MTHPTPANVTPEEIGALIERVANSVPGSICEEICAALRALTAAKRASEERWAACDLQLQKEIGDRFQAEAERTALRERVEALEGERDHWKANHDNQVEIKAAVLDRPDLGDRARKVMALIAERDALAERLRVAEEHSEAFLLKLVDIAWNTATESEAVPCTDWARRLIAKAHAALAAQPAGQGRATPDPVGDIAHRMIGRAREAQPTPTTGYTTGGTGVRASMVGRIVRYGNGSTALLRVTEEVEVGPHIRYYGRQCMGGSAGAYAIDCRPASAADLASWAEHNGGEGS
jgi:hypothetical protein